MSIAAAAQGAGKALEEIIGEQLLRAQMAQRAQEQAAQLALQTRQVEGVEQDRASNRENQRQTVELNKRKFDAEQQRGAYEDTARSNMSELITNPTQLAAFSMASGVEVPKTVEGLTKRPEQVQYTYTDPKTGNKSMRFAPKDNIPEGGFDMGNEPQTPTKSGTHVVGGNLVDDSGKVLFTAPDKGDKPKPIHPFILDYSRGIIRKVDDLLGRKDDPVTKDVDESRPDRITNNTAGMGGRIQRAVPWNNAAKDVDAEMFSLASELAITALQKMRASSQTGGGVGNVALGEMEIMKNAEAAIRLDQSPRNLRAQLQIIRDSEQRFLDEAQKDTNQNDPGLNRGITTAPMPGAKDDIDALIDSLRGKPKG